MKKKVNFKLIFIIILMSMFNLKSVFAKYDKVFFDFKLKSISGDEINLSDYKGKTVLLVNVAADVVLQNNMMIYKKFGILIKIKIL